jgi:hypothetical protein
MMRRHNLIMRLPFQRLRPASSMGGRSFVYLDSTALIFVSGCLSLWADWFPLG